MHTNVTILNGKLKVYMCFQSDEVCMTAYLKTDDDKKFWDVARSDIEYTEIYNRITEYALNNCYDEKSVCDMVADCIKKEIDSRFSKNFNDVEGLETFLHSEEVIEAFRENIF